MTSISVYAFEGAEVRVLVDEAGDPWWVAADVARVLGYARPADAIAAHCKGVGEAPIPSAGGTQATKIIPERDVYRLIMRSRLASAERFEEWVVGEVLPSIRKTGSYCATPALPNLRDPAQAAALLAQSLELLQEERTKRLEAESTVESQRTAIAEAAPKVEAFDRIVEAADTVGFREAAKILRRTTGVTENELRALLIRRGWVQRLGRRLQPTAPAEKRGYATSRLNEWTDDFGVPHAKPELRITPKGLARLAILLAEEEAA